MPITCEGAPILEMYNTIVLLKKLAEKEICDMENAISEKRDLIADLDRKATVLVNAHVTMGRRSDPGLMEFKNDSLISLEAD